MDRLITFYNEKQNVAKNDSFSPSAGKPRLVIERFGEKIKIIDNWYPVSKEDLYMVHEKEHVDDIFSCKKNNGFDNKLKSVADSLYWTIGSFYNASKYALNNKTVVFSPTSGFHHATYNRCMGFCTFNGLMVSAVLLKKENIADKIGIIDFDMHWGNGTIDIINKLNIDYVKHMAFSDQVGNDYNDWLRDLPIMLNNKFDNVDILFYQAGADPHIDDPLGKQLTTEQMQLRDRIVFQFAKDNNIPIVWNLAGGYQEPIDKIIDLHENTLKECFNVFKC